MRVIVCGGREYTNRNHVYAWLSRLFAPDYGPSDDAQPWWLPRPDLFLKVGGASGVDTFAEDWASVNWVQHQRYPADWAQHGGRAGPLRNEQMLRDGPTDLVVAFPGGRGTHHMKRIARDANVAVLEIPPPCRPSTTAAIAVT